jgi:membrane protein DedA with SNARE-associated domain
MELLSSILVDLAPYVHFISFGLLLLAGLNFPVSEDLTFIISASLAATVVPENTVPIFIGCFSGALVSDIIAYGIGRFGINRLRSLPMIRSLARESRVEKITRYFDKYGIATLFFGRFFPFGVRNVLFMTSGMIRLTFYRFLLIDLIALCITSTILFTLGYMFGKNYRDLIPYLDQYKTFLFIILIMIVAFILVRRYFFRDHPGGSRPEEQRQ